MAPPIGGDAGLRLGEMLALERGDLDFERRHICVERAVWKGHEGPVKGMHLRRVTMTKRLTAALRTHRHLRGPKVALQASGEPFTMKTVQDAVGRAAVAAGVRHGVHILRHTFCSHLAMNGVPVRSIQALAGHKSLTTTLRYMHLSPTATDDAIRMLETRHYLTARGNSVATGSTEIDKSSR